MSTKIKKTVSILLSLIMVFSMFAIVPLSASAEVGDDLSEDDYLTFTAEEAGSSVTLNFRYGSNFKYNLNGAGWETYSKGTTITLNNVGDYVRFSGKDAEFNDYNHVSLTGKVACSGSVMSLRLNGGKVQGLINYCYQYMFYNCAGLTTAPELPETTLARYCYAAMFGGCTSLTKAPELPATNLADHCYSYMFRGCENLTELPALPATTLADSCYYYMFYDCPKIRISDVAGTFGEITYSAEYRIPTTGTGTSADDALYRMFDGTGGKFTGTPSINTTYYLPAPATFKAYVKKLTGGTYTIENLTGETTVAQLKEIIADQIDIPATAQRLIFAGKQLEDAKTLAEYNIVEESTIHLVIRGYTVTWLNYDDSELGSTTVQYGVTPSYDGETPTKDGVTFAGWTDSHGVFYAKDAALPEVTADETYTAVFELTIGSVDEWNSFAASVKGGNTYSGIIVRMTADVGPVTTMVDGTFSGTFDGDGHTLTVNISGGSTSAATFAYVKDATIQNLRLEGTVTSSGIHTAALVKSVSDTGSTCTIKNVDIYADVNCSNNYIGGFIGHAGTANTVNIENSIFAGSINKTGSTQGNFIGAFIGWSQTLTATINNCAFTGSYSASNIKSFNNIGFSYNAPTEVTVSGFYSNASEVFVANVNHGTRLYVPSSSYPTSVALVKNNDGETFYSAFSDALAAWTDGSTLALLADVTCDSMISVPAADTKTLDLNGNALSLSYSSSTKVEVNGTLTIQSTASGGSITPTTKSRVINVVDGGTLNIESGTINGYNADRAVIGGVGTINLNGGKIVTPASNAFSPDGVATLNLNGGEIECTSGSTSMGTATAVWAHGDSTINWNGTAITTNTGDGIRMKSAGNGTVNVTGGSFTATSSSLPEEGGYAIYCNSNMGTLNLEGNPSISGRGIYLTNDKVINITDELSYTNPISVTMQTPGVFTSGLAENGDATNFANGNGMGYALTLNASGEAQIVSTYTITWNNWDDTELEKDTGVSEGVTPSYDGEEPTKAEDANNTYTFSGWSDGSNTYAADALPAVSGAVTYTAVYTAEPKTPVLPDVIAGCTYYDSYWGVYANVPFVVNFSDIKDGAISFDGYYDTEKSIMDTKDYSYKFYDENGTELQAENVISDDTADGYGFRVIFNVFSFSNPISGPLYIVATAPAPVEYFIGHSITLGGDIGVNFFLDKTAYDNLSGTKTVKFAVDGEETTVFVPETADDYGYKVTCDVVAARMAHKITATLYVDGEAVDTDEYSVQQYAEKIYANPSEYSSEKPEQLKAVAEALLHYGAMAQTVFAGSLNETPDHLADVIMPAADFSGATAENIAAAIKGSASDLNTAAAAFDAEFYTSSLIYLSRNTLRLYFTPASKTVGALNGLDFSGNLSEYYYYVDVENIAAAELDNQQTFSVNGTEFTFSALDYAKAVVNSNNMSDTQKDLAKSLYLYNQAANAYFDPTV